MLLEGVGQVQRANFFERVFPVVVQYTVDVAAESGIVDEKCTEIVQPFVLSVQMAGKT